MYEAQLIMVEEGGSVKCFGEWEERQKTNCMVSLEVAVSHNADVQYQMRTKNREDEGDGDQPSGNPTILVEVTDPNAPTDPREGKFDENLEELVRDYIHVGGRTGGPGFVVVRVLPKIWYDAVKA